MAVQAIRQVFLQVGEFAEDSLRCKAKGVTLELEEFRECDNDPKEAEEMPVEWRVVESWGGQDSKGGTETAYSGADKSAAVKVL